MCATGGSPPPGLLAILASLVASCGRAKAVYRTASLEGLNKLLAALLELFSKQQLAQGSGGQAAAAAAALPEAVRAAVWETVSPPLLQACRWGVWCCE